MEQFEPFPSEVVRAAEAKKTTVNINHDVSRELARRKGLVVEPVKEPEYNAPSSDPLGISIALPSQFVFYDFKDIFVQPLRSFHLAKLSRAHSERSIRLTAEVVSSILTSTSGIPNLAHRLTLPDFYAVLYFMRFNFYTKTAFIHTTTCDDPEHLKKVREGKATRESLRIQETINKSMLTTRNLEEVPVVDGRFTASTIQDLIDYTEHPSFTNEEFQWLGQLACYLKGSSFKEKMEIAASLTPDEVQDLKSYSDIVDDYGVDELITVKCKECGASVETKVSIDAHSFLPS